MIMAILSSGVARILMLPGHRSCTLPKAAYRGAHSFFAFIFQLPGSWQDGLSWHLRASHCKQFLFSKVSWRAWHCAELALFMLALLRAPSTKFSHSMFISISELLNSYLPIGLPGHNRTLPGLGYANEYCSPEHTDSTAAVLRYKDTSQ